MMERESIRQNIIENALKAADGVLLSRSSDADELNLLTVRLAHKLMDKVLIAANMNDLKKEFLAKSGTPPPTHVTPPAPTEGEA